MMESKRAVHEYKKFVNAGIGTETEDFYKKNEGASMNNKQIVAQFLGSQIGQAISEPASKIVDELQEKIHQYTQPKRLSQLDSQPVRQIHPHANNKKQIKNLQQNLKRKKPARMGLIKEAQQDGLWTRRLLVIQKDFSLNIKICLLQGLI